MEGNSQEEREECLASLGTGGTRGTRGGGGGRCVDQDAAKRRASPSAKSRHPAAVGAVTWRGTWQPIGPILSVGNRSNPTLVFCQFKSLATGFLRPVAHPYSQAFTHCVPE